MDTSFLIMYVLVIFIAIPERFFYEIGITIEGMGDFPYLLFWLVAGLLIYYSTILILHAIKKFTKILKCK